MYQPKKNPEGPAPSLVKDKLIDAKEAKKRADVRNVLEINSALNEYTNLSCALQYIYHCLEYAENMKDREMKPKLLSNLNETEKLLNESKSIINNYVLTLLHSLEVEDE